MNDHLRLGRALKLFDGFIRDYVDQSLHAHFADNDNNAAERVRRAIRDASASIGSERCCDTCDHPKCCHDGHGVCHALDMPKLGIYNDCICKGN